GIVVRATGGDGIDGLAARGTGAHDLEKMPWLAVPEVQMSEEQMLVQPARHQVLSRTGSIQKAFPLLYLAQLGRTGLKRLFGNSSSLRHPPLQCGVLNITQTGYGKWHTTMGIFLRIGSELDRRRATVSASDGDI